MNKPLEPKTEIVYYNEDENQLMLSAIAGAILSGNFAIAKLLSSLYKERQLLGIKDVQS